MVRRPRRNTGCSNLRVYRRHTGRLALARVVALRISLLAAWNRPIKVTWQGVERLVSSFMALTCHPSYVVFPHSAFFNLPWFPLQLHDVFFQGCATEVSDASGFQKQVSLPEWKLNNTLHQFSYDRKSSPRQTLINAEAVIRFYRARGTKMLPLL